MTGKGFLNSTAALLTGIGTLVAALVALAILLVGEGVLFKQGDGGTSGGDPPGDSAKLGNTVEIEKKFGRAGTGGIELDSEAGIVRNSGNEGDIVFYDASGKLGSFSGSIVEWTSDKQPTQQECSDLLDSHGFSGTYDREIGSRFCVRSSGGRTAFLAVISDGREYQVSLWRKG